MNGINIGVIVAVVAVVVVLGILMSGYVKASPDKAYIISGLKKEPKVLIGRAGIKIPFLEKKDELMLRQISIDIKTNGYIPTKDFIGVDIDAVAKVRVLTAKDITVNRDGSLMPGCDPNKRVTHEMVQAAMKNFLNMKEQQIREALTDSLQGNMREIIGTQCLKELCNDRKTFGDEVQAKAQKDMNALGIWIESCNIQKIEDENNLITALGQDNMSQIQKDASVAKAQADRDVAIARAQAQKDANDAQVIAETEIAQKQTELAIKKAELKKESDIKKAEADAAYKIQEEEQRKTVEITTANANLARQEKELELKEREVSIKEKALEAEVKKTAEANKYAAQQKADAEQYERQKRAEAELFEIQRQAEAEKAKSEAERFAKEQAAEAVKAAGLAEAAAVAAKGKAEAEAIQAKAEAEAAGILKKAEAMKQYGDAARQQMELDTLKVYFEQLPKIAEAVAKGYMNVDSIKMFGGDSSKLAGDIMTTVTQVTDGIKESTGLDINAQADRDVAIARAQAQKDANDAQVIAETEIAQKQTELAIKKAELKKESDIKKAEADAAYKIQEEEQRKTVEITTANANLARQEKELELKEREVSIKEKALEAEVKKTAEANKYAAQQKADAEQYERQKRAEAELFEIQRQAEAEKAKSEAERFAKEQAAEAVKAAGLAEAAAVAAKGKAEAEAIQAKAEAEAAGILKKAEAMKQYGDAARQQMELDTLKVYFEQLPKIAEAVAKGYMNVDSIKMFGGDSSTLAGDIMTTVTQVTDGIKESTGLDINEMLAKGFAKETKSEETGSTANADYHEVKPE